MLAALIVLAAVRLSAGQTVEGLPARVTLDRVLKLLEERSPRTLAERATIDVVAADRITANTLPNPSLSYGGPPRVSGPGTDAGTQHQLAWVDPLRLFGRRR